MAFSLAQDPHDRGREKVPHCFQRIGRRRGWLEDTMMRYDAKKLIQGRPEQRIGMSTFAQILQQLERLYVMLRAAAMRMNEDVRVEREHALPTLHQLKKLVAVREIHLQ